MKNYTIIFHIHVNNIAIVRDSQFIVQVIHFTETITPKLFVSFVINMYTISAEASTHLSVPV